MTMTPRQVIEIIVETVQFEGKLHYFIPARIQLEVSKNSLLIAS